MNEGVTGCCDFFSDALMTETQDKNGDIKPAGRLNGKRKKDLGKSRKKREKRHESSVTSTGATAAEDGEDEESSDLPPAVSSTSGSESLTKAKIKEMKFTKRTTAKKPPNFAKIVKSLNAAPFVFQKRLSRIDWRKLHTIDVDRVIREVDLDALESVIDTITFGDIQGEDTRNFSEANFIKVFRLAQLMVEYLLNVQELLASHKDTLLASGAEMQHRVEKQALKHAKLTSDLSTLRHNLKQAKKTIRTYEIMLRVQNKVQRRQQNVHQNQRKQEFQAQQSVESQTVRCCPLCDKLFESAYYLDLHVARRHPRAHEISEDTVLAAVGKAEEAIAARVRADTTAALQAEIKLSQAMSQADLQRAQAVAQVQVSSLEASLRESNTKLLELQRQLQSQTPRNGTSSPENERKDGKMRQRMKEMDQKLLSLEDEVKHLNQENSNLMKDLRFAHSEAVHKQMTSFGRDQGAEDLKAKPGNWKTGRPASADRKMGKERRKWNRYLSTSPERSESEGRPKTYNQMISNRSSPSERKRKPNWQQNHPRSSSSPEKNDRHSSVPLAEQDPSFPARHRKYKSQEDEDLLPEKNRTRPPFGSHTPTSDTMSPRSKSGKSPKSPKEAYNKSVTAKLEITHDLEAGVHAPPLEARFQDVSETTLTIAKAQVEEDLVRAAGENRHDDSKVANKIAIFETKVGPKKIRREEVEGIRRSEDGKVARSRETKEKLEAKKKQSAEEIMEEEARRRAEIADAATMDVGEDQPSIPPSEKEKWLEEHPYKPIPQRPHVLSKYPHAPDVFSTTRDELAHRLDEQLSGELKKFGFGRNTAAISDSVYDAAKAVLEKQHKTRVSNLQLNHKRTLEYERGAILWQTQRAVHDRDTQLIERQFDAESDNSPQESLSPSPRSHSTDESDDNSMKHGVLSPRGRKVDGLGRSTSPVIKSPQSSWSPTIRSPAIKSPPSPHVKAMDKQVKRETHIATIVQRIKSAPGHNNNLGPNNRHATNESVKVLSPSHSQVIRFKGGTKLQSAPHSPHSPGPTYLFPTVAKFEHAEESRKQYKDDEHHGETFGLGEWSSDDEDDMSPARDMRNKGKRPIADHGKYLKSSKELADSNSNDDSEENKIFQELDAEIDEIIRL